MKDEETKTERQTKGTYKPVVLDRNVQNEQKQNVIK
jgi:hypothetical protein